WPTAPTRCWTSRSVPGWTSAWCGTLQTCWSRTTCCYQRREPKPRRGPDSPAPVEHRPRRRAGQVALDAVLERARVDLERAVHGFDRVLDVAVGVRVAHDQRRHQHAAPDRLLQEE